MCWHCYEWHQKALLALAGEPPPGCQDCGVTFDALKEASGEGNVRMSVVLKDGVYAVLCVPCADAYCRKRSDLFRSTEYGRQKLNL